MNRNFIALTALALICCGLCGNDWLQFRGPGGSSISKDAKIPVELADHIDWQVELPGKGPASPIVVGDRVIVTCSSGPKQDQIFVVCFNANDGKQLWSREFWAQGRCFCHPLSANAAPTPASDGKNIYAFYSSNDLVCLDLDGNLKWYRALGVDHPKAGHDTGMSSSPVVADGVVVCQVENQADSFVIGIDAETGETMWEKERTKDASWASPVILPSTDGPNVLIQSPDRISVLDLKTGEQEWELENRTNPIPTTTVSGNRLYLPVNGTTAYQFSADGQFNELWNSQRVSASRASLLADTENLYTIAGSGIVNCFDASEGNPKWKVRVGGTHWSTPVIAGEYLYLFSQEGAAAVVNLADENAGDDKDRLIYEHTFENQVFLGSPAVSNNALFMRSDSHLFKFKSK